MSRLPRTRTASPPGAGIIRSWTIAAIFTIVSSSGIADARTDSVIERLAESLRRESSPELVERAIEIAIHHDQIVELAARLTAEPLDARRANVASRILDEGGERVRALDLLEASVERFGGPPESRVRLVRLLLDGRDLRRAREVLERAPRPTEIGEREWRELELRAAPRERAKSLFSTATSVPYDVRLRILESRELHAAALAMARRERDWRTVCRASLRLGDIDTAIEAAEQLDALDPELAVELTRATADESYWKRATFDDAATRERGRRAIDGSLGRRTPDTDDDIAAEPSDLATGSDRTDAEEAETPRDGSEPDAGPSALRGVLEACRAGRFDEARRALTRFELDPDPRERARYERTIRREFALELGLDPVELPSDTLRRAEVATNSTPELIRAIDAARLRALPGRELEAQLFAHRFRLLADASALERARAIAPAAWIRWPAGEGRVTTRIDRLSDVGGIDVPDIGADDLDVIGVRQDGRVITPSQLPTGFDILEPRIDWAPSPLETRGGIGIEIHPGRVRFATYEIDLGSDAVPLGAFRIGDLGVVLGATSFLVDLSTEAPTIVARIENASVDSELAQRLFGSERWTNVIENTRRLFEPGRPEFATGDLNDGRASAFEFIEGAKRRSGRFDPVVALRVDANGETVIRTSFGATARFGERDDMERPDPTFGGRVELTPSVYNADWLFVNPMFDPPALPNPPEVSSAARLELVDSTPSRAPTRERPFVEPTTFDFDSNSRRIDSLIEGLEIIVRSARGPYRVTVVDDGRTILEHRGEIISVARLQTPIAGRHGFPRPEVRFESVAERVARSEVRRSPAEVAPEASPARPIIDWLPDAVWITSSDVRLLRFDGTGRRIAPVPDGVRAAARDRRGRPCFVTDRGWHFASTKIESRRDLFDLARSANGFVGLGGTPSDVTIVGLIERERRETALAPTIPRENDRRHRRLVAVQEYGELAIIVTVDRIIAATPERSWTVHEGDRGVGRIPVHFVQREPALIPSSDGVDLLIGDFDGVVRRFRWTK